MRVRFEPHAHLPCHTRFAPLAPAGRKANPHSIRTPARFAFAFRLSRSNPPGLLNPPGLPQAIGLCVASIESIAIATLTYFPR